MTGQLEEIGTSLIEVLDNNYPEVYTKEARTERLSPTRIVKCQRGGFLDSIGYPEPKTFQMDINFEYGTMRHEAIQNILNKAGWLSDIEPWVEIDDPPIGGFCDGVLTSDPPAVLEIKTAGSPTKKISKPYESYLNQITIYMYMLDIPRGIILYESKDKAHPKDWKFFPVEYDEERMKKIVRKTRRLLSCLEEMRLPFPEPDCYCQNSHCFNLDLHRKLGLI